MTQEQCIKISRKVHKFQCNLIRPATPSETSQLKSHHSMRLEKGKTTHRAVTPAVAPPLYTRYRQTHLRHGLCVVSLVWVWLAHYTTMTPSSSTRRIARVTYTLHQLPPPPPPRHCRPSSGSDNNTETEHQIHLAYGRRTATDVFTHQRTRRRRIQNRTYRAPASAPSSSPTDSVPT